VTRATLSSTLTAVLALSYFGLAHTAAITQRPVLMLGAASALALAILTPGLIAMRAVAWLVLGAAVPTLYWLQQHDLAVLPLYAPPILINVLLAWGFGRTLIANRTPLIYRFVELLHPADAVLDPAIRPYARKLTLAWMILFACMATINLGLALCAVPDGLLLAAGWEPPVRIAQSTWSLFANVLSYLIVGMFFAVEFAWRRVRFPNQPYQGFIDFMRKLAAIAPRARAALRDGSTHGP
jgi:uncharacterized membrane protein